MRQLTGRKQLRVTDPCPPPPPPGRHSLIGQGHLRSAGPGVRLTGIVPEASLALPGRGGGGGSGASQAVPPGDHGTGTRVYWRQVGRVSDDIIGVSHTAQIFAHQDIRMKRMYCLGTYLLLTQKVKIYEQLKKTVQKTHCYQVTVNPHRRNNIKEMR